MRTTIVVLDADEVQRHHLCRLISEKQCPAEPLKTLGDLNRRIAQSDVLAVMIDIDSVEVDNRAIRELTTRNPDVYFFCLSKRRLHPELEDAIGSHLYACINKPVDPDELLFWISSVRKEGIGA